MFYLEASLSESSCFFWEKPSPYPFSQSCSLQGEPCPIALSEDHSPKSCVMKGCVAFFIPQVDIRMGLEQELCHFHLPHVRCHLQGGPALVLHIHLGRKFSICSQDWPADTLKANCHWLLLGVGEGGGSVIFPIHLNLTQRTFLRGHLPCRDTSESSPELCRCSPELPQPPGGPGYRPPFFGRATVPPRKPRNL